MPNRLTNTSDSAIVGELLKRKVLSTRSASVSRFLRLRSGFPFDSAQGRLRGLGRPLNASSSLEMTEAKRSKADRQDCLSHTKCRNSNEPHPSPEEGDRVGLAT